MRRIRVVVDARVPTVGWGGVQQVVIGLAAGLTSTAQSDLDIRYLCYSDGPTWLAPYVATESQFAVVSPPPAPTGLRRWASRSLRFVRPIYNSVMPPPQIPRSNGLLEGLNADVVHFPHQSAMLTSLPSIYQPHDLQHLHLPEFFSRRDVLNRERQYRAFCAQASLVAMASTWGRDDILRAYGLPEDKVAVVPLAPVVDRYPELTPSQLDTLRSRLQLPDAYAFYPAQTWPHKNHERLIRAVAQLRDRNDVNVPLVFSGAATPYRRHLEDVVRSSGLAATVRWVGYVSPAEVRALYRLARCVVVPTLFESTSQPIFEALSAGVAVVCSNVTSAPRQVGDAAVMFDPYSVDDMASAIQRVWSDENLRHELVRRGHRRIAEFTWERTARHFAAYYRKLGGAELSDDDRELINAEPII